MQRALDHLLRATLAAVVCAACGMLMPMPSAAAPSAAPTITVPGPQTVGEGSLLSFNVSATDPDGQTVMFRISGLPAGASFVDHHNNTATFSWTPDTFQAGSYVVLFTADDLFGGIDTKQVSIQVLDVNSAPVLDPIGDKFVERGGFLSTMVTGSDPDGDALSYSASGLPSWGSLIDYGDGTGSLNLAPPVNEPPATTSATVSLSDGALSASETFSITVYAITSANAPVLAPIGNQTVNEGATQSADLSASDADGDALSWTVALPAFATLAPLSSGPGAATARLTMSPGFCASGSYSGTVGVSDGALSDEETFSITVNDVNRVPAWTLPSGGYALSVSEGASADLNVLASDPDQACGSAAPSLSYLSVGAPASLTVTFTDQGGGSGLLHVAASFDAAGSYTLHLRATDSSDPATHVDTDVHVTVGAVNRAPVASAGGPYAGLLGSPVAMSAAGSSDPDGDALTYAWSFGDGTNGVGVSVSHTYAATGEFAVSLTASDGSLSATDATTATVSTAYAARAFMDASTIRLNTGKPREPVYLEPVNGTFELGSVDQASLRLSAPDGFGTVSEIQPVQGKTTVGDDRDHNGVMEMRMEFAKEDLRSLFANVTSKTPVTLVLTANLVGGGSVSATIGTEVWPERKGNAASVHPNPMNPEATFSVTLARPGFLTVRLYDLSGRLVRTIADETSLPAGLHEVRFNGRGNDGGILPSGLYFYRVETPLERSTGSLTILK